MLKTNLLSKNKKYLLSCSGGIDSIALLYLLSDNEYSFDVAHVNYNYRNNSKQETENLLSICKSKNIKVFTLDNNKKKAKNNLEMEARNIRYSFFDSLMDNTYEALITGHNLNDRVEWLLMQFTKGAGISELTSLEPKSQRKDYQIIRPLIETNRDTIENFINDNNIVAFHDESNFDFSYHPSKNPVGIKRNYFRKTFANQLTREFTNGIKKSFEILDNEKKLFNNFTVNKIDNECFVIVLENIDNVLISRSIDNIITKHFNYKMSGKQRTEVLKQVEKGIVINNVAISLFNENKIIISTFVENYILDKKEKEFFRKNKTPVKSRSFLAKKQIFSNEILYGANNG